MTNAQVMTYGVFRVKKSPIHLTNGDKVKVGERYFAQVYTIQKYRDIKDYIAKDGEMEERIEKRTAPIKDAFGLWKKGELTLLK